MTIEITLNYYAEGDDDQSKHTVDASSGENPTSMYSWVCTRHEAHYNGSDIPKRCVPTFPNLIASEVNRIASEQHIMRSGGFYSICGRFYRGTPLNAPQGHTAANQVNCKLCSTLVATELGKGDAK